MNTQSDISVYSIVLAALLGLLVLTVWFSYIDLGRFNLPLALAVAFIKMFLVLAFFMHLRGNERLLWLVAAAGFLMLSILLGFSLADYASRRWEEMKNILTLSTWNWSDVFPSIAGNF